MKSFSLGGLALEQGAKYKMEVTPRLQGKGGGLTAQSYPVLDWQGWPLPLGRLHPPQCATKIYTAASRMGLGAHPHSAPKLPPPTLRQSCVLLDTEPPLHRPASDAREAYCRHNGTFKLNLFKLNKEPPAESNQRMGKP